MHLQTRVRDPGSNRNKMFVADHAALPEGLIAPSTGSQAERGRLRDYASAVAPVSIALARDPIATNFLHRASQPELEDLPR